MPIYDAPTKDTQFVLHDVLNVSQTVIPGYEDLDRAFSAAVLTGPGSATAPPLAAPNIRKAAALPKT